MFQTRASKVFVLVSLFILLSDALFVLINYQASRNAMLNSLSDELNEAKAGFELALDATENMLEQTASFIAGDERVQQLFLAGKLAVAEEGGGKGGIKADQARQQLLGMVGPGWNAMRERYRVRQLHFHLGPGSNSFLRVHRPEKYGDNMDEVRYTIVDANQKLINTRGFETGRVYSGIRGVTPVFALDPDTGAKEHVGALEAGTSFPVMFSTLRNHLNSQFAVLLHKRHMAINVWPEFLDQLIKNKPLLGDFYIEASSDRQWLMQLMHALDNRLETDKTVLLEGEQPLAYQAFVLRDYRGGKDPERADAGIILIWRSAESAIQAFRRSFYTNVVFAVIAFVLLELILFLGVRTVTRHLESRIKERTQQLDTRNKQLAESLHNLKTTQSNLLESEKMASLGRLVAGVTHDISTPLNTALAAVSELSEETDSLIRVQPGRGANTQKTGEFIKRLRERCDELQTTLRHAADRVMGFKQVAIDQGSKENREISLNRYLSKVLLSLQPKMSAHQHVIHLSCPETLVLKTRPGAISQILNNLIMNSLTHAFEPGQNGLIMINIESDNNRVKICFSDDGKGISETIRPLVFEPFFTTKRDQGHAGLGLSIVYSLVTETLGGTVWLNEDVAKGTEIRIEFPLEH